MKKTGLKKAQFQTTQSRILVFAKEPQLGKVKTRMHSLLSQQQALELHKSLLRRVFFNLQNPQLCPVDLWVGSNPGHEFFLSLAGTNDIHVQSGGDLGSRMQHAVAQTLLISHSVILIGGDCPAITPVYLEKALSLLSDGCDVVLGPAEDGGYVLLGLSCQPASIFNDIPWGSDKVLSITRERLEQQEIRWRELEVLWDVDRPEDLSRLSSLQPELQIEGITLPNLNPTQSA